MVVVGIPENPMKLLAPLLVTSRRSIAGSGIGGIKETQEMLDFCEKNNITCDIENVSIDEVMRPIDACSTVMFDIAL